METHLLGALEGVVGGQRDGDEVLVCVDERVRHRDDGGVVQRERDGSNSLDTGQEPVDQLLGIDVQNTGLEHLTLVVDLDDGHTVRERRDVQHVQERRLGRTDTGTGSDDLHVGHDFNRTTGDLGRDTESLEEGGLSGLHTSVTGGDGDIERSEGTGTSGSGDLVGGDDGTDVGEVTGGEDEADVALDVGEETLEGGVLGDDPAEGTANHGVLAHEDNTLATEGNTDLMHLVRSDVVDIDNEDGG